VGHVEGGAQGGAGITRCGLDPQALERALLGDHGVGHAVEGDAPGKGQGRLAGLGVEPPREVQEDLLEPDLHARGQVGVLGAPVLLA
jgi:hypothetical protein